ncbi:hypothetical protein V5799_022665 [Amblyomma americanum]|uniref:Brinker DNA-binding domain-containing protein n=1 Tax=Amblyomma americanum TaxID=6943 RepID=A0AAQ4FLW3_AMBAM
MGRTAGGTKRFDADLKLRVLAYYDKVRNKYAAAKMFGVSECSVRNWIKAEHELRARQSRGGGTRKRTSAEAQALLEACMEHYVRSCQQRGVKAKYGDLLAHAAQLKKVHRVRGLKLSIDWVARFVRERKLVCKCEKLVHHDDDDDDDAGSSAAACRKNGSTTLGKARAKGLSPSKQSAAKALLKRAKGQLSSSTKASTAMPATKHKGPIVLAGKRKVLKASSDRRNDGKTGKTLSKNKPAKKDAEKGRSSLKKVFSSKEKKVAIKNPKVKATAAGKNSSGKPKLPAKKAANPKAKPAKSVAIVAKYKKSMLKKDGQKQQKTGLVRNDVPLKKKVQADKTKHMVAKRVDKVMKVNNGKQGLKVVRCVNAMKKKEVKHEIDVKSQKKACIIKKAVTKSLKKAKEIVNRARRPAESTTSPTKQPVPKIKKLPPKKLKPRKQPIKVFRTRYRIKEMHRRIEENRASDFFDFFYGLGLIPINRDSENSLCIPFIPDTPKMYDNAGFICDIATKEGPLRPSTSDLGSCQSSTHPQLPQRYPIWTPVRATTSHDASPSHGGKNRLTSPRLREEHIISDRFTQPESPGDDVFFEKFHKASIKSEGALSPGESPITPEQLAVVRKLFPPIGSLTFPTQRKVPDSQVTFNEPLKASERNLRPRSSEQTQRLSLCFRKRRYQRRKRTLSEPSRSPERRPNGPAASDIDWLSADSFPSSAKKSCPGGSSPLYCFSDPKPCFRKEHFEDSARPPPPMSSGGICGNSSRTLSCGLSSGHSLPGSDRSSSSLLDSAKFLINKAIPTSPKATSSSEGKDTFFGQAVRLGTLRKKQDRNDSVMHAPKGHPDH